MNYENITEQDLERKTYDAFYKVCPNGDARMEGGVIRKDNLWGDILHAKGLEDKITIFEHWALKAGENI